MPAIDPDISQAIITVLQECAGKPLAIRPLTTYANGYLRVEVLPADVQLHISDLERKGYVERRANPFAPSSLEWVISPSGKNL